MLIEYFAVGGAAAVEIFAVPGSESLGAVSGIVFRSVGAAGDHVGLADAIHAATLGNRVAQIDYARARGHAINRVDAASEGGGLTIGAYRPYFRPVRRAFSRQSGVFGRGARIRGSNLHKPLQTNGARPTGASRCNR